MADTSGNLLYLYKARTVEGKVIKGKVHAPNEPTAVAAVEAKGLIPLSVRDNASVSVLSRDLGGNNRALKKPKLKDLAVAMKQLGVMIGSGVTLLRALEIASQQTENTGLAAAFSDVRREVGQGSSLSAALERRSAVFPPMVVNMVRVGETGGFLEGALESVSQNLEAELRLQQKVKSAMAYPVVVLCIALLSVTAILIFVVPVFERMFASFGSDLPLPTQILVSMSRSSVIWMPLLALVIVLGWYWYSKHKRDDAVRRLVDSVKIRLPLFGSLFVKVAIARFTRNLAVMLNAGVPMLHAISLVSKVSNNWVVEDALADAENSVRHGRSLAEPLSKHSVFPPMVTQMVAVGEESGSLGEMLTTVSEFYDREVETASEQLTSIIEPLLIVFIGVVIGGMMIALYLPIFMMSTGITGGL